MPRIEEHILATTKENGEIDYTLLLGNIRTKHPKQEIKFKTAWEIYQEKQKR